MHDQRAEDQHGDRQEERDHAEHDRHEQVVDRHVEHETDAERQRADAEREDLDDEEQQVDRHDGQPSHGPEEVLEVAEAVLLDAVVVEHHEHDGAQPSVMFQFDVGGVKPGMRPRKLAKKMKTDSAPMSGKYRFARLGPIMSFIRPYQ